jgi:HK97 family phage portal protein
VNLFDRLFGRKATELTYDQVANLIDGSGGSVVAGVAVNDKTALQVSTVLACVKAIADGCATPDLHVYREQDDGTRQKATNIPEYRLLARRPNEWQTSFEWRRQMTIHAALTGAALSIKVRGDNRRVRELLPVTPGNWTVERNSRYGVTYRCFDQFGTIGEFKPDDVFLLHNIQWDWVKPLNAVSLARSAIGLAMATERSQSAMHANGLRPSGTYTVEGNLNAEQHERLSAFLKRKSGPDNTGTPLILDRAAKWFNTSISGVDAQHVETRRLQIEEICRAYGVFPIMVGHSDKSATFASSEAFFSAHVKHTLAPWHRAWTQRIDEMLLDGSGPLFAEFDVRYLIAGDTKDRAQWARTMVEMGIYTRNEIRDNEGLDPLPGLDEPLTPLNMTQGNEPADEPKEPEDDAQAKQIEVLERKLAALESRQQPAPAPVINNYVTTPDVKSETHVHNAAPAAPNVEVRNEITVPETTVNVEAIMPEQKAETPIVQVTNQVQPTSVVVNNAFPTKAVQVVERDAKDEITKTVTTYEG